MHGFAQALPAGRQHLAALALLLALSVHFPTAARWPEIIRIMP